MSNVLFQIATEFHYLVALSIIDQYYSGEKYQFYFIVPNDNNRERGRLKSIKFNKKYHIIDTQYSLFENQPYPDVIKLIEELKKIEFSHFIAFHVYDPIFIYMSWFYKNKSTKCHMAPDGLGAYVKHKGITLGSRFKLTYYTYRFFAKHKLLYPVPYFCSYRYGYNGYLDNLYSFSKQHPFAKKGIKISELKLHFPDSKIEMLNTIFMTPAIDCEKLNNVFILINQGLPGYEIFEKELLSYLTTNSPDKKILYKKHPNTPKESLDHLKSYNNLEIIYDIFPVELLISRANASIIISSHSTSMLYHNPNCTYFWTYPLLERLGIIKKKMLIYNPTNHINVISSIEEIQL